MAIKMISKWYFGSEDKEEVKKYSREISVLFKINGYNPKLSNFFDFNFFDFFDVDRFSFIPCIREGLFKTSEEEFADFEEEAAGAIESAYDSSTVVTLADLEKFAKNGNRSTDSLLKELVDGMKTDSFVDFVNSCGSEVQSKFVDWIFNKSKK